ncbi:MAG TPA: nucleotide sugar dehydrogenase [Armatimonadota bacterium]|jgi:UDP-N-acetyl-D-mannosaminuronic acid dehydrogenase
MSAEVTGHTNEHVAVVGIGYVGLTLLCALGKAGFTGLGYDINAERVQAVRQGQVPFAGAEVEMQTLLSDLTREGRLSASNNPADVRTASVIFLAVETPVEADDHRPRYTALRAALASIAPYVAPGALVVVESTLAPGTIEHVVSPILAEGTGGNVGRDFFLVHCPERVMPGRLLGNLLTCDRVVGGVTPHCTQRGLAVYARVTSGTLYPTDALTAEIVKTAENAYRDVQIAFANELALMCEDLGADVYQVRELVNSSPYRQMHMPGAGVGGHCIPKDPWLLCSAMTYYQPQLLPTARAINDGMPEHLVALTQRALAREGRTLAESTVTLLGAAYLEETDDTRNTPALAVARLFTALGARVRLVDPYVDVLEEFTIMPADEALAESDALVLITAHPQFRDLRLDEVATRLRTRVLIDGRNAFTAEAATAAGLRYLGIGKGTRMREATVSE